MNECGIRIVTYAHVFEVAQIFAEDRVRYVDNHKVDGGALAMSRVLVVRIGAVSTHQTDRSSAECIADLDEQPNQSFGQWRMLTARAEHVVERSDRGRPKLALLGQHRSDEARRGCGDVNGSLFLRRLRIASPGVVRRCAARRWDFVLTGYEQDLPLPNRVVAREAIERHERALGSVEAGSNAAERFPALHPMGLHRRCLGRRRGLYYFVHRIGTWPLLRICAGAREWTAASGWRPRALVAHLPRHSHAAAWMTPCPPDLSTQTDVRRAVWPFRSRDGVRRRQEAFTEYQRKEQGKFHDPSRAAMGAAVGPSSALCRVAQRHIDRSIAEICQCHWILPGRLSRLSRGSGAIAEVVALTMLEQPVEILELAFFPSSEEEMRRAR